MAEQYDDEQRYENEYNIFERVGFMDDDVLAELGTGILREDAMRDPTQRFYIFVDTIARQLNEQGVVKLSKPDIQFILSKIKEVPSSKYKNPTGFVLGFHIARNGQIDKNKFEQLKPKLPNLEYPLHESDVLRYGNLWVSHGLLI